MVTCESSSQRASNLENFSLHDVTVPCQDLWVILSYEWKKIYVQLSQVLYPKISLILGDKLGSISKIQMLIRSWCHFCSFMMTSPNGNIFFVTGPLCGEFTGHRSVTRSFDVFFDLGQNKRLCKPSGRRWFETPSHYCDVIMSAIASQITRVSIVYSSVCSDADQR